MQKKSWSPYQDNLLRFLKEDKNIKKWTQIATIFNDEYKIKGLTGKLCKQRYQQRFSSIEQNMLWSLKQQKILFMLHNELGNKWAIISRKMNGRTDNCIKNHFYSKLRKGLKYLNTKIQLELGKSYKQIKYPVIFKIIQASEDGFKNNHFCQEDTSKLCFDIKNKLIQLSYLQDQQAKNNGYNPENINCMELYDNINGFSKYYKRKPKKLRRIPTKPEESIKIQNQLVKKGFLDSQFNILASSYGSSSKIIKNSSKDLISSDRNIVDNDEIDDIIERNQHNNFNNIMINNNQNHHHHQHHQQHNYLFRSRKVNQRQNIQKQEQKVKPQKHSYSSNKRTNTTKHATPTHLPLITTPNNKHSLQTVQLQKRISFNDIYQCQNNLNLPHNLSSLKKKTSYFDFLQIEMQNKQNMFEDSQFNHKDNVFMRDFLSLKRLSQPDIHFME